MNTTMLKGEANHISPCGNYLAVISSSRHVLELYEIKELSLFKRVNLITAINAHTTENNISIKDKTFLKVTQVTWEEILVNKPSSKIGILIENYSLIMIIDIREDNTKPIIIQQSQIEGISKFQWIPPVENEGNSGAYINSKQIMIFSEHNLQAKLFSLDCTSTVFTILKPAASEILIRPNRHNSMWCLTAYSLNYSSSLIIYFFYNTGSVSTLFYEYKLSQNMISDFEVCWSKSGKWLYFLNTSESLFGFNLRIFNSLGIHETKTIEPRETIPVGGPILNLNWKTDGIERGSSATSLVSTSSTSYFCRWLESGNSEFSLISSMSSFFDMELVLVSIKSLAIVNKSTIKVNGFVNNWIQISDRGIVKYRKYTNMSNQLNKLELKDMVVSNSYVLFDYGDSFLLSNVSLNSEVENITYESIAVVRCKSAIRGYKFLTNKNALLIVAEDHLAILDIRKAKVEIIFNSRSSIRHAFPFQDNNMIGILTEHSDSDEIILRNWDFINMSEKMNPSEDNSDFSLMKKYEYKEDNRKVLGLINDANRFDTTRVRRNRFSLLNSNTDEITDTFSLIKRQKK